MKRACLKMLAASLVLTGCTAGPDYEAPDLDAPAAFVSQDVLKALNEGREDQVFAADWWTGFEDSVLDLLVAEGIGNNLEIVAATARVRQAVAILKLAGASDNLSAVAAVDGVLEERRESGGDDATVESIFGSVAVVLPLDISGRTRREVASARAGLEESRALLKSVVLATSTAIAGEYLRLRGNQRQLELLRESVELQEKTLEIVRSRYRAGLAPELDVRRAEASVENLRADIPPLEQDLLDSRNRLAVLTGQYAGVYEDLLLQKREIPAYQSRIPDLVPLEVLGMRPDVRAAEARFRQTVAEIGVAEAAYFPILQLGGQVSVGRTGMSGAPAMDVLIASLNALVEQVITDGGAREAGVEIARAQAGEALANYMLALRSAGEDVEATLSALDTSARRQESLEKAVRASEQSFYQAETLYQQGLISFLDVVDAQRVLANARQGLAAEQTGYATQIANLFRVLGVDIENGPERPDALTRFE